MSKARLGLTATLDIPLEEVSGICAFRTVDGSDALAAMGDASSVLAWARAEDGALGAWQHVDLADAKGAGDALARSGTQAEAVAADSGGLFLLLLEEPSRVLVFDIAERAMIRRIELTVPPEQPIARSWAQDPNSRGEGLVLLADGHLLVVKEKDPPALVEFGPAGAQPRGLGPDRLTGPGGRWQPPAGEILHYEALATWLLADELAHELGDVSDAAVAPDGSIYVLSDQSSRVVILDPVGPPGSTVTASASLKIEGKPDKAEGLAILGDGRILVALDTRKARGNLLVLALPAREG